MTQEEYSELLTKGWENLHAKTIGHQGVWNFGEEDNWSLDQDVGDLIFTFPEMVAVAQAQIISSFDSDNDTWVWAWANQHVDESLSQLSENVKKYGEENNIEELIIPKFGCSEHHAWELSALACFLSDSQGVYRGQAGSTYIFIAFGDVELEKIEST